MAIAASSKDSGFVLSRIPLLLLLIAAGLAGNYFSFQLFLNVDFLFGSIFAMLALQFLGLGPGVVAAALIASYTYILWNHPYSIIIMTVEVGVVGWLLTRRKTGLVLADTLYWLFIGMPLVFLFYHLVMNTPLSNAYIIMTKQAANGITNALLARLIYSGLSFRRTIGKTTYRENIYNLLALFVLCPTLIILAIGSRGDFAKTDQFIRTSLAQESQHVTYIVNSWLRNRTSVIVNLAELAATMPPALLQPRLDQARAADANFLRIGMRSNDSEVMAYSPLIDEFGKPNVGKKFAERPYIPKLRQTLMPMLAEVVMARINRPEPAAIMLTPILHNGEFSGYINGVLNLQQLETHILENTSKTGSFYSLIDQKGLVISTNRPDQKVMTAFDRGAGKLTQVEDALQLWVPLLHANTPAVERWGKSRYIAETAIGDQAEWTLIYEQPVAPYQQALFTDYANKFLSLFGLLLAALGLAEFVSRRAIVTLNELTQITHALPARLASGGTQIDWPQSRIAEAAQLTSNFKQMADSLSEQFQQIAQNNELLEQRVEERTRALKESEQQFRALFDNSLDAVFLTSPDGSVSSANPAACAMFGWTKEELCRLGRAGLLDTTDPRLVPALEKRRQSGSIHAIELTAIHKDGTHFPVEVDSAVLPGAPDQSFVIMRDIAQRKLDERQLELAKEQAEAANLAKSQFLANMSHEIRSPMNGILGMAQILEMTELSAEQRDCVETLELSGKTLLYLLDDILDLSKIEAGETTFALDEFSLRNCIQTVAKMQSTLLADRNVSLKVEVAEELPPLLIGDQGRVRQIIHNLLGNAVKFTEQGTITLSVRLQEPQGATQPVQIMVRDTGIGIAPDALERIFLPFIQEDPTIIRRYGGTGLGLTICRNLAELLGGQISVESTLGAGSCFTLTIPFAMIDEPKGSQNRIGKDKGQLNGQQLRILFAEDDPVNIAVGSQLLGKLGHEVVAVENGRACLEALESGHFDVVLMDIQMPVMNGRDALSEIRKKEQGTPNHQPVIALTAFAMRGERERLLADGFDGYVSKPLGLNELLQEMGNVVKVPVTAASAAMEGHHE